MNEFLTWFNENWKLVATSIAALVLTVSTVFGIVFSKQLSKRVTVARKVTFTKCPHCGELFRLSDADFILPNGKVDNDLNGIPDEEEKKK